MTSTYLECAGAHWEGIAVCRLILSHRSATAPAAALGVLLLLAACATPGAAPGTPSSSSSATVRPTSPVTPTASPSPTATPPPATWSKLAWNRADKTFVFGLIDVRAWQEGYVGIGQVWDANDQASTAFFASDDGLAWQVVQRLAPGEEMMPMGLLATHDGLLGGPLRPGGPGEPAPVALDRRAQLAGAVEPHLGGGLDIGPIPA